eukprot:CAMPEP_0172191602 /NCGR_PEP_ID=MMETSP1050-20130122/23803_1 /TAXON_ID=233186 /ORGANISM="Cryptomonas curvata, Strain CCAP979/52" /LENGTH=60 /DNA_ID=CAMNT_0012866691 /DNA_START=378 /DNA_END=556 /DNA_ORIENTATION=+
MIPALQTSAAQVYTLPFSRSGDTGGADEGLGHGVALARPEVGDLDAAGRRQQDVGRLHIP